MRLRSLRSRSRRVRPPRIGAPANLRILSLLLFGFAAFSGPIDFAAATPLTGKITDADGNPLPARVYLQSEATGDWLFVDSSSPEGSALPYREQWVPTPGSVEKHTTLSAHPFRVDLDPGRYTLTIERGKEYHPFIGSIEIGDTPVEKTFRLRRWIDLAARGWYSGETHVHRRISELPNVMLAEDLNVAFPVTFWTVDAFTAPGLEPSPLRRQGPSPFGPREDRGADPIFVDDIHVIFPRNTEYEVFHVGEKRHVLGALFILNHRSKFTEGMPPVRPIAEQAHREGALLDLDKHSWPWSMMLVPVAGVNLFELSNNSVWRTSFGMRKSPLEVPDWMNVESGERGLTEWGWLNYGWETYYLLLNCGFRLQPSAGTASGVHPVPLGHSRVYVHTGKTFDADRWFEGLRSGRSFITTGPMLFATLDDRLPGEVFENTRPGTHHLRVESVSANPIDRVEVIVNGEVRRVFRPEPGKASPDHTFTTELDLAIDGSSWIVVRSIGEETNGRRRFAHTAPWHIEVPGRPLRPRRREVDYLVGRVTAQIERNREVLPKAALAEFEEALHHFEGLRAEARP